MNNLEEISIIETALVKRWTVKALVGMYAEQGYFPDQAVAILSGFIPSAHTGLNDDAVRLICNSIKHIVRR